MSATVNWGANANQKPDYYNIVGTTPLGNTHSTLGNKEGKIINDPYAPDIKLSNTEKIPIFLHIK